MAELSAAGAPVSVVRSARRRRTISIGVSAGTVTVRAPVRTPLRELEALLASKEAWIRGRLELDAERRRPRPPAVTGSRVLLLGRTVSVRVTEAPIRRSRVERGEGVLEVMTAPGAEGDAERALLAWFRNEATSVLSATAAEWAARTSLAPRAVIVKEQRRRWGSCGPDGTLRLNWRLVMAPREVIDYVVVHELAHLKHRNHGAAFWAEVERVLPDHKLRRKTLREMAPLLESGPLLPDA